MDEASFRLLTAELEDRHADVTRIAERIASRTGSFDRTPEGVDSMAYQLHNLYGAFEQLFETVAQTFENQIAPERYHTDLLRRMRLCIEGVRPQLLSHSCVEILDELRRFRHVFRHAYTAQLEAVRVGELARRVPQLRAAFAADMTGFLHEIRPA